MVTRESLRQQAELTSVERETRGISTSTRRSPTMADAVLSGLTHGRLMDHENVGRSAREVVRVCEEYDVPLEPTDVTVIGGVDMSAPLFCDAYGTEMHIDTSGRTTWRLSGEPDGYLIYVSPENWKTNHSIEEAVRHEMAHLCGLADEGVTYEQCDNHAEWCDRLDTW